MGVYPERRVSMARRPDQPDKVDVINLTEKKTNVHASDVDGCTLYNWTDGFKESERCCSNLCLSLSLSVHLSALLAVKGLPVFLISSLLQLWTQHISKRCLSQRFEILSTGVAPIWAFIMFSHNTASHFPYWKGHPLGHCDVGGIEGTS